MLSFLSGQGCKELQGQFCIWNYLQTKLLLLDYWWISFKYRGQVFWSLNVVSSDIYYLRSLKNLTWLLCAPVTVSEAEDPKSHYLSWCLNVNCTDLKIKSKQMHLRWKIDHKMMVQVLICRTIYTIFSICLSSKTLWYPIIKVKRRYS